jgi:hypothetical protein
MRGWSRGWAGNNPGKGKGAVNSCRSSFGGHDGGSEERKEKGNGKRVCIYKKIESEIKLESRNLVDDRQG